MALVAPLDPPTPETGVHEPHIAIDPANPRRIAVGAQYGIKNGHGGYGLYLWFTDDCGKSWSTRRVPRPVFDTGFAADPFLAFASDGSILYFGDCAPRKVGESIDRNHFNRLTVPDFWATATDEIEEMRNSATEWRMGVSRSDDGGRTFTVNALPGSADSDKPSVAVDRLPTSPYLGNVYAAWAANFSARLLVSTSTDHGRTFAEPIQVLTHGPSHRFQLALRADGSVHLVWYLHLAPDDAAPPDATTSIFHSYSTDGGITFSAPAVVAHHGGTERTGIPTFAADARGALLFVWGEAESLPDPHARPVQQARRRLYAIRSDDGATWTAPYEICDWMPADAHVGLPALTTDGRSWWLVCYLADYERTDVTLLRSDDGTSFDLAATLATRPFGVDNISLWGSHLLAYCDDVAHPGDYIGIAATPSHVASAFILPETEDPISRATAYIAIEDASVPAR